MRDRILIIAGLAVITALGWAYLRYDAESMHCATMAMPESRVWNLPEFGMMLAMWTIMMIAMMAPSAAPMLLAFAAVNRRRRERQAPYVPTAVFLLGYIAVWTAFSVVATAAQFGLQAAALLSPMLVSTSSVFGAGLLITAGLFQWTPLKNRCLAQCHSPFQFLMVDWREGSRGAFHMGVRHGSYCLGCCWAVMALLFVAGVMNLLWVAALSVFVLAEKLAPKYVSRSGGAVMILAGVWLLV